MDDNQHFQGPTPHDRAPHLAHHFDSNPQQHEAAKLGMWLFLATEVLLFGGLFCLYAIFRANNPELFSYGSRFLDSTWGAINTTVLIISSLTMAIAVRCAQGGHHRQMALFLFLTLMLACDFLGIKYIEYSHKFHENLLWNVNFYEPQPELQSVQIASAFDLVEPAAPDPVKGQKLWKRTCRTCHGLNGEGMPDQGKDIRGSEFISSRTDKEMLVFVKTGRMPSDPLNTTGRMMPPSGGNPMFTDEDLGNIIAYVRTFEAPSELATAALIDSQNVAQETKDAFWISESSIPSAATGPPGLNLVVLTRMEGIPQPADETPTKPLHPMRDPNRPANTHLFFSIYFMMTGLHGMHVVAGMGVIMWLLIRAGKGHFSRQYFTPVDLGGLYWHLVDVIWIFLFPLFYLI